MQSVKIRAALRLVRARVLCEMRAPYKRITNWLTAFWLHRAVTNKRNNCMDRGRVVPQLLGWGTNNVLVPLNFLAVVFKKQEIS